MSVFFSIEAILADGADTETLHVLDDTIAASSQEIHVSYVKKLRILPDSIEKNNDLPLFAAVFVPSSLVEASLKQIDEDRTKAAPIRSYDQKRVSQTLLPMIHPFLAQSFTIKAVISVVNEQHAPADVVLVDLSHAPLSAVQGLADATNGQLIHACEDSILEVLLVSNVRFLLENDNYIASLSSPNFDIPTCPVCLYRIDPLTLGLPKPRSHELCSKFCPPPNLVGFEDDDACPRQKLLRPWPLPSQCVCCRAIQEYWKEKTDATNELTDLFCCECAMQETLWVCMTCGFVGCGRYSNKHAAQHFQESRHPYSLELATLRIWDYVGGEFVHRPDLLECPSSPPLMHPWLRRSSRAISSSASHNSSTRRSLAAEERSLPVATEEKSPKKATMIGEEYEALLQSALEEQAQHYEGEITGLRATLTAEQVDAATMTIGEKKEVDSLRSGIARLRAEIDHVGRDLLHAQAQEAGHRATSQRLLREQQVAQSLLEKIKEESSREHAEGRRQIDELEQQIADLTANQRMRHQFAQNEELMSAQIFGTTASEIKTRKKGGGKKSRRLFRK